MTTDGTDWHVQLHQNGLGLTAGQSYTVKFWAKADKPRTINVYTGNDQDPWHHIGLERNIQVGPEWKRYVMTFAANEMTKTITIEVQGDNRREANEMFYVDLFGNSSNSLVTRSRGLGTILNDD